MSDQPARYKITNRHGLTFFGHLYEKDDSEHLAIVQHGFSGSDAEPHIQRIIQTILHEGYRVLSFECTHAFNDADGTIDQCTITTHLHDLEDGIAWAKEQSWYRAPFLLSGQSLGGMSVILYAADHPETVSALFPAAPVLNGPLTEKAFAENMPKEWADQQSKGYEEIECSYAPGRSGRRVKAWFEDLHNYDCLTVANQLTMPVLMMSGTEDAPCPADAQQQFFDRLNTHKVFHLILGADHNYGPTQDEMAGHLSDWLKTLHA